jgi:hypothetical protein
MADMICAIVKISPDWNVVSMQANPYLLDIQPVPGGGFIQSSYANSTPAIITKMDEAGVILWSKSPEKYIGPLVVNPDGSIVVASVLQDANNRAVNTLLFKISKDGVSFEQ